MSTKGTPRISVIIPVYNTGQYLRESIGSIMNQTFRDLEIIVVNDGSTDNSEEIIRELMAEDERITIIIQENQGLSCARNSGMRIATGKYLYFMDSDDSLDLNALEHCYTKCEELSLDFVFFDAENIIEAETQTPVQNYSRRESIDENKIWKGCELLNYEIEHWLYRSPVWLYFVNRIFLDSFFQDGFYPGIIHEDHLFTVPLHLYAKRVGYIPFSFFKRRIRENSIMTKRFSLRNIQGYVVTAVRLREMKALLSLEAVLIELFLSFMLNAVMWEAHRLSMKDKLKAFSLFYKNRLLKYIRCKTIIIFLIKW